MKAAQSDGELKSVIEAALERCERVGAAYVYGSAARGTATPISDVDVALVADGSLSARERGELLRETIVALERERRGTRFDVRFLDELPAAIAGRVVGEGTLAFERSPEQRVRAEVRARMLYHDFLYFEQSGTRAAVAGLRKRLTVG